MSAQSKVETQQATSAPSQVCTHSRDGDRSLSMATEDTQRFGVVFVTASSQAEAEAIAAALINAKLSACVSFTPIHSVYTWQGQVHKDQEWQLLIKTDLAHFDALAAKV